MFQAWVLKVGITGMSRINIGIATGNYYFGAGAILRDHQ